jgi:4-amino-4-deoxy-L-arabinose transferase-like glycosyltransferase
LVGLVTTTAGRRYGLAGGLAGGFALAIMPRVFAHAHFGALDTFVALFWTWALLRAVKAADSPRPFRALAFAGLFWGLALLTKIHGWLLPPLVFAWLLMRLPWKRAVVAMSIWVLVGLVVFVVGWPWLWYDSWHRLSDYLNTGLHRATISTRYFGFDYADKDVPWHYPWLYFLVTVPPGMHLLGGLGVWFSWRERRIDRFPFLLLGAIVYLLALFSTRVPVYDGERLFLAAFPLWAILIGRGFGAVWDDLNGRRRLRAALVAAALFQGVGAVMIHPFGLSYYNVFVGGLKGAERLGLELTFWGDSVDRVLLDRLAEDATRDSTAALGPTLAPEQGKVATSRSLARKGISLEDQEAIGRSQWVVVYRREAYWTPEIRELVQTPPIFLRTREGVWLSGIWRR